MTLAIVSTLVPLWIADTTPRGNATSRLTTKEKLASLMEFGRRSSSSSFYPMSYRARQATFQAA
jgi:hypothetical protein